MRRTETQRELADAVRELANKHAGTLHEIIQTPTGYSAEFWADIAAMGLPGIAVAEHYGGAGGELADLAVVLEELGRWLLPSPLFATAALAAPLLQASRDESAKQRWLPPIAEGELRATVALANNDSLRQDNDGHLTGTVTRLVGGASADLILVLVNGPGPQHLFGIEATQDGLKVAEPASPLDPTRRIATAHLEQVAALPITTDPAMLIPARDTARVLLAAEQLGGAQRCLDMALEYAMSRIQFNRPIGSFQAIKHLCADIYADIACARALLHDALTNSEHIAASSAAAVAAESFVRAAERNMQIHGGISYTWEHDCHLYLRRARASERLLGTVRDSYDEIALALPL